jgi:hypothetical protein
MTASESTFVPLRRQERQRRISALRQRLRHTLGQSTAASGCTPAEKPAATATAVLAWVERLDQRVGPAPLG